MAYKIIWYLYCCIQPVLMDFFGSPSEEIVDCRTLDGQQRYIEIFGLKKFKKMAHRYNHGDTGHYYFGDVILSKTLLQKLFGHLHERSRRLLAAFLTLTISVKNQADFAKFLGIDVKTIRSGINELNFGNYLSKKRIRRTGGGRMAKNREYRDFSKRLEDLADDHLAGDPMSNKRWVRKTLQYFQDQLKIKGIRASLPTVRKYLRRSKIFLKGNVKSRSTQQHKDRDRQFRRLNYFKRTFLKAGKPVISVDTKKKEKIGLFKSLGRLWRKDAKRVLDHDFPSLGIGKAIPFGIYDLKHNRGYMYVGTSHETSQFIVEMIVKWWREIGRNLYHNQSSILILCDAGGANGYRRHGWKWELATQLSSAFGLKVTVCHYPPGASKWNPIEHKLFSFISINWSGEPLTSYEKMLEFINTTTTKTGLTVTGILITKEYLTKTKYTDTQMAEIKLNQKRILPAWNYTILPH